MKRLLLFALLGSAVGLRASVGLELYGGLAAPLSPLGPNSFATAHQLAPLGWGRLSWQAPRWSLGAEGYGGRFARHDGLGQVDWWQSDLSVAWAFSLDELAGDRVQLGLGGGYGGISSTRSGLSWNAPAGSLSLSYALPLSKRFDLLVGGGFWGILGPDGYDPLVSGSLGIGLGFGGPRP
jgi:hypothetical protein